MSWEVTLTLTLTVTSTPALTLTLTLRLTHHFTPTQVGGTAAAIVIHHSEEKDRGSYGPIASVSYADLLSSADTQPPQQLSALKVTGCSQLAAVSGFAIAFAPPDPTPPPQKKPAAPVVLEAPAEGEGVDPDAALAPAAAAAVVEEEPPKPPRGLGGIIIYLSNP